MPRKVHKGKSYYYKLFELLSIIRSMVRELNKLKSDIVVMDTVLETSAANYSKGAHRIKNAHYNYYL